MAGGGRRRGPRPPAAPPGDVEQPRRQEAIERKRRAYESHTAWTGDPAVGARLADLWTRYHPPVEDEDDARGFRASPSQAWRRRVLEGTAVETRPPHLPPAEARRLWRDLRPFRARLPTLRVYLVDYPSPVSHTVPPVSVILGAGDEALDSAGYAAAVLRAAGVLATGAATTS